MSNLKLSYFRGSLHKDGRQPRLPRKRSDKYELLKDTNFFFSYILRAIKPPAVDNKYSVVITVKKGSDKLGSADLDNYSKTILDGITKSKKIWKDDKQIDELIITRVYRSHKISTIEIVIKKIT